MKTKYFLTSITEFDSCPFDPTKPVVPEETVNQSLLTAANGQKTAVIDTLERLVNIESGSADAVGMAEMNDLLEQELKSLGFAVTRHPTTGSTADRVSVGDNIVGVLHGNGGKNIMLQAHQDTVYARGALAKAPFRVEGDLAYGPGIADAKGGIAVILHSLKLLKAQNFKDFGTITVLFNTDEEQSSVGSKDLITSTAKLSDYILSFEPTSLNPEGLPLGASGIGTATVAITGLAAHAGAEPEKGVNAIVEAADLVLRTADLDEGKGGLRFTWTMAQGGEVRNVVPASASLTADIRYPSNDKFNSFVNDLKARVAKQKLPEAKINLDIATARPAFDVKEQDQLLIDKAIEIYKSIGYTLQVFPKSGGGTDAAFAALSGNPVIEGLGLPGVGYHTTTAEYISTEAIPRRLYLTAKLMMNLAQSN